LLNQMGRRVCQCSIKYSSVYTGPSEVLHFFISAFI
jgi:hypothetical protein